MKFIKRHINEAYFPKLDKERKQVSAEERLAKSSKSVINALSSVIKETMIPYLTTESFFTSEAKFKYKQGPVTAYRWFINEFCIIAIGSDYFYKELVNKTFVNQLDIEIVSVDLQNAEIHVIPRYSFDWYRKQFIIPHISQFENSAWPNDKLKLDNVSKELTSYMNEACNYYINTHGGSGDKTAQYLSIISNCNFVIDKVSFFNNLDEVNIYFPINNVAIYKSISEKENDYADIIGKFITCGFDFACNKLKFHIVEKIQQSLGLQSDIRDKVAGKNSYTDCRVFPVEILYDLQPSSIFVKTKVRIPELIFGKMGDFFNDMIWGRFKQECFRNKFSYKEKIREGGCKYYRIFNCVISNNKIESVTGKLFENENTSDMYAYNFEIYGMDREDPKQCAVNYITYYYCNCDFTFDATDIENPKFLRFKYTWPLHSPSMIREIGEDKMPWLKDLDKIGKYIVDTIYSHEMK